MTVPGNIDPWKVLGWTADGLFFSRFLVQWIASERASKSVAPRSFWWLSLFGAVCLALYTNHRGEPVLFAGAVITGLIYARNLMIAYGRAGVRLGLLSTSALALLAAWVLVRGANSRADLASAPVWLVCSIVGQSLWSSRFVVQWWMAEREQRVQFPRSFWWISLAGNMLLLAYAIHRADPILIVGYTPGPLVQIRNLMLSHRSEPGAAVVKSDGSGAIA